MASLIFALMESTTSMADTWLGGINVWGVIWSTRSLNEIPCVKVASNVVGRPTSTRMDAMRNHWLQRTLSPRTPAPPGKEKEHTIK